MGVLSQISDAGTDVLVRLAELDILGQLNKYRLVIALAGMGAYVLCKLRGYWRLRGFKGPWGTGFFGLWHCRAILSHKSHKKYKEVIDHYGPIARIGPNSLLTSDPDLWMHMSSVRSAYSRATWFVQATRFQAGKDHVFSQVDEAKHKARRQQMAPGYSGKENLDLEESIDIHIAELITLTRTKYLSTDAAAKPMDLARKMSFLTLDVISRIGFGEPFGDLRADADVDGFLAAGDLGLWLNGHFMALGLTEIVHIPWVFRTLGPSERDKDGLGKMVGNARRVIEARLAQGGDVSEKSDMLASFMRHGLGKEDLITEACLQIIAGADTTATTLKAVMLYVLSHPRVYRKLQREVDEVVKTGQVAPFPGIVSDAVARKMPYLQAVVKEGMRIHPPVTNEVPKRVPDGGDAVTIDGEPVWLPGGTYVGIASLGMLRRRNIFGEDVDEFRPERWLLEEDERKLAVMSRTVDMVFGYGKYQCLGKAIALTEIGKTLFEMMRNFDWCLANPEQPWKEFNFAGLFTHSDMWVLATERGEPTE